MTIIVRTSGGLRGILTHLPERLTLEINHPISIREVLINAGIHPRMVMKVFLNGVACEKEMYLDSDAEILAIGPMAGG
jgi:hypothetical protein